MQVTQADQSSSKRVGVAEHLIKFRSSPNFKNMKKFIRSKMDHIEVTNHTAPDPPPPPNGCSSTQSEVQPPLPLDPPPPDDTYSLQVKQEVDDSKYDSSPEEVVETPTTETASVNSPQQEPAENPKVTICRDFIRGSCKRPGTCRYAHKYDLSQLVGVYTFCRRYQTSVCTLPNCKYVHATVFEEHHFYRTGILPPHALAHHKKNNVQPPQDHQNNLTLNTNMSTNLALNTNMSMNMPYTNAPLSLHNEAGILPPHALVHHKNINQMQPPPPPPPPPPPEVQTNFSDSTNMALNHSMLFTNPPPALKNEMSHVDTKHHSKSKRILLEHQNNIEPFGSSPSDRDTYEPFPKKCKHCDIMDFRLQYHKDEVEKMALARDQKIENKCELDKKKKKINALILTLFKLPSKNENYNDKDSSQGGDKDKTLLDQLSSILSANGRMTSLGDDE